MMQISNYVVAVICCWFALVRCSPSKDVSGNYVYKTECMGSEMDGSITVKAWGNGRDRFDAVEQAKKNAINDILFNGIYEGKNECFGKPLMLEVNARTKHKDYFNNFFKDKGEFLKYISLKDERIIDKWNRDKKNARQSVTYGIVLRILRSELEDKLVNDGILKQ